LDEKITPHSCSQLHGKTCVPDQYLIKWFKNNANPTNKKMCIQDVSSFDKNKCVMFRANKKESQRQELPPTLLAERSVNLSAHSAPVIQPAIQVPFSNEQIGFTFSQAAITLFLEILNGFVLFTLVPPNCLVDQQTKRIT
jgi:hypothetical protein